MLDLELNPALGTPIYRQIVDAVRERVAAGVLRPGDRLPSIRDLAVKLRINPASAVKAYGELRAAGIIVLDERRGTFVSDDPKVTSRSREEALQHDLARLLAKTRGLGFADEEVLRALKTLSAATGHDDHAKRRRP